MPRIILLCFFILSCTLIKAQDVKNIPLTISFNNKPVTEVIKELQTAAHIPFYYDSTGLDSIKITYSAAQQPLTQVLEHVFTGTDLRFSFYDAHVFITRGIALNTSLREGFLQHPLPSAQEDSGLLKVVRKINQPTASNRLYEIGQRTAGVHGDVIVTGNVHNAKTGEPVANASIFVEGQPIATTTDQYGHFSLKLATGNHTLNVQATGLKNMKYFILVNTEGRFDMDIGEQVSTLKEIVVTSKRLNRVTNPQLGVEHLTIAAIKNVPAIFGEPDVLRVITTLPGVKTVGEASTGFNVRGGSADQNLILLNGLTIFNPAHFFGMFSAFNPDVIKDIELYKSTVPAQFGGRLSSVLDITAKEGNKKNITGTAGLGLITSRLMVEGPITKDRTSFIFGARTTYANWLMNLLPDQYNHSRASFYDANLGISHHIDAKNDVYFNGYISYDKFRLTTDTTYQYHNANASLKWKHGFTNKLTGAFTVGYDKYAYKVTSLQNKVNAYQLQFAIGQLHLNADFNYFINSKHNLDFGASSIRYSLTPGSFTPQGNASLVVPDIVPAEQARESAVYLSDKFNVSQKFTINAGLRFSFYQYLGPQDVRVYAPGLPKEEANQLSTKTYQGGDIKNYMGPEVRLALRYAFNPDVSIKAGLNTSRQYIHVLSNTTAMAPTDIWKLSDPNIRPQYGEQLSLGLYRNLRTRSIETSIEVYYKRITDYLDYKSGAVLVLNHHIETDVMSTRGKAYGVELMIKKTEGKLNGWISYTYSRILLQMDDSTQGRPVNQGKEYPASYDIPHEVTAIGNYKINHRFSLSMNVTYSTGRPITLPSGRFFYLGSYRVLYSDRNTYRIPDYFRADFSMNIDGNHKVHQRTHNSWAIGVYNLTGRKNPYSVYYVSENGQVNGYRLSIFGSIIPFINFNIRF